MMPRVIGSPVIYLMLAITAILGAGYSSAQYGGLVFSTYLGGATPFVSGATPLTFAQNAACDTQGNIYVTGATTVSDLPGTTNAFQPAPAPNSTMSAFVAKYNPVGQLLWCTYLGGNNQSMGVGVAAMPSGGVAVAGLTTSDISGPFPTMNACQAQNNGLSDYFVTVFDANGNLQYSTYLGGSGVEGPLQPATFADDSNNGNPVAVDAAGLIYVAGMTNSSGSGGTKKFPVTSNALQSTLAGSLDACLCIINPSLGLNSLIYASFLGGSGDDQGHSIAVNASGGNIALGGYTNSPNFPTINGYRNAAPPPNFTSNGFITQIQSSQPGSPSSVYTMSYSTYLGANTGDARDDTYGITLDPTGLIVATGRTQSGYFPQTQGGPSVFPTAPYLTPKTSNDQPYVVKINPSLNGTSSLVYSTFLGGGTSGANLHNNWGSFCTSVGVDSLGGVYVGGETGNNTQGAQYAPSTVAPQTFPFTSNAMTQASQGSFDAIFMQIVPGGSTLGYSTFLGGTASDRTYGLAVDPSGNVVLSGLTFSSNFPIYNQAQQYPNNGAQNAFVTKFSAGNFQRSHSYLLLLLY
jgi:hypothetical protein